MKDVLCLACVLVHSTAVAQLFQVTTWRTFQCLCESTKVLRLPGHSSFSFFQYVVPLLMIRALWEKTSSLNCVIDDYSSWNPRLCTSSNETELTHLLCRAADCLDGGWRVPLQRCGGPDLYPSQGLEVTAVIRCVLSLFWEWHACHNCRNFFYLENPKCGNKLLPCWFVC